MNKVDFVSEISKLRPGSTFLTVKGYTNNEGEVADFSIVFNMSYENALKRSIAEIEKFEPQDDLQHQAKREVLQSWNNSLAKMSETSIEEIDDAYERFFNENGEAIQGIKMHRENKTLFIYGLLNLKKIILPIAYKQVNHRPLTIQKQFLIKKCPVSRFRQFAMKLDKVNSIKVQGLELLPPQEDNEKI